MNNTNQQLFSKLVSQIQNEIFANKKKKGFNITNVPLEFCLVSGELAEAFDAWKKKKDDLGEELADVFIYLLGLSSILKIDLGKEILNKLEKNEKREYYIDKGVLLKK
ncbi:MazG nucleotide pyrophosphohydrolase domain-containing protein [Patescibacteria group bacterium]